MAKVSICIPAYENPESLDRLLDSIEFQTYKDFEVYITDDSKSGVIEELVKKWSESAGLKGKIKYEHNASSKGATANTDYCMGKVDGEYIKIMHHDDYFYTEDSLRKMVALLDENPDVDFAFAGTVETFYDANGEEIRELEEKKTLPDLEEAQLKESPFALFLGNFVEGPSTTIVRNRGIGLDHNLKWLVDIDYYIRILRENPLYAVSKECLIGMGHLSSQVTQECLQDTELIFNETKYVYIKYKLGANERHTRYLCTLGAGFGKKYKDYEGTGIKYKTYLNYKMRYTLRKIVGLKR